MGSVFTEEVVQEHGIEEYSDNNKDLFDQDPGCPPVVSGAARKRRVMNAIEEGIAVEEENYEHEAAMDGEDNTVSGPIVELLKEARALVVVLPADDLTYGPLIDDGYNPCSCCEGGNTVSVDVFFGGDLLMTMHRRTSETRFPAEWTAGDGAYVEPNDEVYDRVKKAFMACDTMTCADCV